MELLTSFLDAIGEGSVPCASQAGCMADAFPRTAWQQKKIGEGPRLLLREMEQDYSGN